ncbi:MAG TPA: class I SAM-dependent methyltransferase [Xanthobacteraceae bacterium]|jgi:predicted O-methyltransferase YrrM
MSMLTLKRYAKTCIPKPMLRLLFKFSDSLRERTLGYQRFVTPGKTSSSAGLHRLDDHALAAFFDLVLGFDHRNCIAIDCAHNIFVIGAVLSKKPRNILELGIGTGYLSMSLVHALKYNQTGRLTSVDNWLDTHGWEPRLGAELRAEGVEVVCASEEEFVRRAPADAYDFLVSDADHQRSWSWLDEHIRIVEHDGFMFFHDTNQPDVFPGLAQLESRVKKLGLPFYHFTQGSREDEHCTRGILFVINKKVPVSH